MTHLRPFANGLLAGSVALALTVAAHAQDGRLGGADPSDMYFQAWLVLRDAKKAEESGEFTKAFDKYEQAKKLFDTVALYHPRWKADLVKSRLSSTAGAMESLSQRARDQHREKEKKVEDLVEGSARPGTAPPAPPKRKVQDLAERNAQPAAPPPPPKKTFEIPQPSPEERRNVARLQDQITAYRKKLDEVKHERDLNAARLRRTVKELEAQRDAMARAPIDGQMQKLEGRIEKAKRERDAMGLAFRKSREEHHEAKAQVAQLEADTEAAKKREAELKRNLEVQQSSANRVVTGLRRQLTELQDVLKDRDKQLASANVRADQLERQLREAQAELGDLRSERDSLLEERDQLAALLKLNDTDRVQRLIKQNMELGRELKRARERVQEIWADSNHTKDQLTEAKRDLAVAKARILDLRKETESQKHRLSDLERRLAEARRELNRNLQKGNLDPIEREEVEMLRDLVHRQLRVQERRRQQKNLLLDAARHLPQVEKIWDPLVNFANEELKLTKEENELISDLQVDDEFVFSGRPSAEELDSSGERLQQNVAFMEDIARRAYSNERYLLSRQTFRTILDEHPGHVPSMLNLGVVHLRLDEHHAALRCFEDAIVIRRGALPFAHFMIGVTHYERQDFPTARTALLKAIDLDPDNADAHVFLGNVAAIDEDSKQAEHHWRQAIRIDSTLTDPFYNLAVLEARRGNKPEARILYQSAIRNGADPDLNFESRLAN